ncbi:MAG: hypothetical protein SFU57_11020 [Gemmatimonadales bacterium]|nr:hypothetical protein [Gemmatimonadales bacterium]
MQLGIDVEQPFELSVILAEAIDNPDLGPSFKAIERACIGLRAEVLVVRPGGRTALPESTTKVVREIVADESTLVPDRWGLGVIVARAPIFACLTTELTVHPEWARVILAALQAGASETVGAAGAIALAPAAGPVAAAVYLVRFNAFLPRDGTGGRQVHNIPGDTGCYRRDAVTAYPDLLREGFWETEFHRRFGGDGKTLLAFDRPLAVFTTALTLRSAMRVRARHGLGFGATRVSCYGERATLLLLAAPFVPFVLLVRILRRAAGSRGALLLALRSLPALALICGAWAWGEVIGALSVRTRG